MTIAVGQTGTYTRLPCNGVTVAFNFPNKIFAASDLVVNLIDTLGVLYPFVAQANIGLGLSYVVNNVDNDTGCSITMNLAPTNGWSIDLRTQVPEIQTTSIKNQGQFLPELHEEFFDRATRMLQDLYRLNYQFGIHGPDIENTVWPALPAAAVRKNTSLIFDGNGLPNVGVPVAQTLAAGQYRFVGTDSGAANAYVVAVTGTIPVTLTVGALTSFTAINGNTGASTANIGGTGVQPMLSIAGAALAGGEVLTSGPTWVQWTGAAWQIVGTGAQPANVRTAAELAASVTPTNYAYPPGDVRRYGALGAGGNDTGAFTQAMASNAVVIVPAGYVFLVTAITPTTSCKLIGGGTIKQSANPGVSMIFYAAANSDLNFEADGVTFDGNQAAQGALPANFSLDFRSAGTTKPTLFRVVNCTFINGAVGDIRCFGNQTGGLITAQISNNHFLGGSQGDLAGTYFPRSVDAADAVNLTLTNNTFDLNAVILYGRAGLVAYYNQSESIPVAFSSYVRVIVTGNNFNRMGRDQPNGQGPVDLYGYSVDAVIANNVIRNSAIRAINVKASDPRVIIANNQVDSVGVGLTQLGTGIVCNSSTTADFQNDIIIEGNVVTGTTYDAIFVNGTNVSGTGTRNGVIIRENIVRNCATGGTGRDIGLQSVQNADISGNICSGNGAASSLGVNNCVGFIGIRGNQFISPAGRCVLLNAGDNNSLAFFEFSDNLFYAPGLNGLGSALYLSNVGGANITPTNRLVQCLGTPINMDQSASITAAITGTTLLTVTVIQGTVAVGQVLTAPAAAANDVSLPGTTIASFGTGTGGLGTYNLSQAVTNVASQAFLLTGNSLGTSQATPRTCTLHRNTNGMITVSQNVHFVDTQGGNATGNLNWINGGYPGMLLTLTGLNGGRVVTLKNSGGVITVGNINLGADFPLTLLTNSITLEFNGVEWHIVAKN